MGRGAGAAGRADGHAVGLRARLVDALVAAAGAVKRSCRRAAAAPLLIALLAPGAALGAPETGSPPEPAGAPYRWRLPAGFPRPVVLADNPMSAAKVELGRRLFYDPLLSGNRTFSCASCHRQEHAFTDGRARALGSTGEEHPRGAMTLTNVAYNLRFNWGDPRTRSLEDQMLVPMLGRHPVELGLASRRQLVERLGADAHYRARFAAAFPGRRSLTFGNAVKAIAAFERTLISGNSPYDRRVFADDREAMGPSAERGMELFHSDRLRCDECHGGFNFSGPVGFLGAKRLEPEFHNTGLFDLDGEGAYPEPNRGVFEHTRRSRDMGRFRAPTLRNIELTAPYMHDGSLATLEEVVAFYAAGGRGAGRESPLKSDKVRGFEITPRETADLIAFLTSLTDHEFVTDPRFCDPRAGGGGRIE